MKVKKAIVFILWWAFVIWFFASIVSCSPQIRAKRKLKRADRLIEKAKRLDPSVTLIDTVIVHDTVITERVRIDTTFLDTPNDTIEITKEKLKIRFVRDTVSNTVYLDAQCQPDTIVRKLYIPQEKLIIRESFWSGLNWKWKLGLILFAVLLVLMVIRKLV